MIQAKDIEGHLHMKVYNRLLLEVSESKMVTELLLVWKSKSIQFQMKSQNWKQRTRDGPHSCMYVHRETIK